MLMKGGRRRGRREPEVMRVFGAVTSAGERRIHIRL